MNGKICLLSLSAVFLASVCFLSGCAALVDTMALSPAERQYVQEVKQFPLNFNVPKAEAEDAWGRAQSFIAQYSSLKIETATNYVIQTYKSPEIKVAFAYSVTRAPLGDIVEFTVECTTGNEFAREDAWVNARILACYIATGKLPYPHLIIK
jgi:hypothetical protein